MGTDWTTVARQGSTDSDEWTETARQTSDSEMRAWKNPDTDNENIKRRSASPEEVHLNPADLDLAPEDVQADSDNWTVQDGPS